MSHIVMIVHNDMRGDPRTAKEAKTLACSGHSVVVLALSGPDVAPIEHRDGYTIKRVALASTASIRRPVQKLTQMRRRRRALYASAVAEAPDIVHCKDTDTLLAGTSAAAKTGARLVYDAHELFPDMLAGHGRSSRAVQAYWRWVEARLIPRADLVITVNESRAHILNERYGVQPLTVLNTPELVPLASRRVLREVAGISAADVIVLYQGGLIGGRALTRLMEAFSTTEGAVLVVEGDGPEMGAMRQVAEASGCSNRVRFMGWVPTESLHDHACGADIGVVIYENTSLNNYHAAPNKLYSYLMAGLPIVSSDFPGLRDVVVSADVGTVFDPADVDSIASAITRLAENPQVRREMGTRARALAEERYNWDVDARRLIEAYDRLGAR
ncbi:MAG: glycosyltransferase family 4 protein [Anaerosomatales bacterium]|nr:glycosyltransferase family 4 protein [Anaerosomatales bacterium]